MYLVLQVRNYNNFHCKIVSSSTTYFLNVLLFTDRRSLFEEDGNLFNDQRVKERLRMPDLQSGLLMYAFGFILKKK